MYTAWIFVKFKSFSKRVLESFEIKKDFTLKLFKMFQFLEFASVDLFIWFWCLLQGWCDNNLGHSRGRLGTGLQRRIHTKRGRQLHHRGGEAAAGFGQ